MERPEVVDPLKEEEQPILLQPPVEEPLPVDTQTEDAFSVREEAEKKIGKLGTGALDFVPIVGDILAADDVAKSYREGDTLGTAVNTLAMAVGFVPILGDVAAKGMKAGLKAVRKSDIEENTPKLVDEVGETKAIKNAEPTVVSPKQKTVKAYKLFKTDKEGNLYPLFVKMDNNKPIETGTWIKAEAGELDPKTGKVKSSIGNLAYRPGFHAGDLPIATHIGGKVDLDTGQRLKGSMPPNVREENQVWAEVEMLDDVDWQSVANSKARIKKDGTPELKSAHITDQVPFGGHYRYKTNANMTGNWLIGGELKVNKILSSAEVKAINDKAGVADLPKLSDLGKLELLTKPRAPTPKAPKAPKPESPASGVKIEPPTKDKDGIIAYTGSKNKDIVEFRLDKVGTGLGGNWFGSGIYATAQALAEAFGTKKGGATYKLLFKGMKKDNTIDYDAPFEQQPKKVKKAFEGIARWSDTDVDIDELKGLTGGEAYHLLAQDDVFYVRGAYEHPTYKHYYEEPLYREGYESFDRPDRFVKEAELSAYLNEEGIKGIKYKKGEIRDIPEEDSYREGELAWEAGNENYVIFDPKTIEILAKYGFIGGVTLTALSKGQQDRTTEDVSAARGGAIRTYKEGGVVPMQEQMKFAFMNEGGVLADDGVERDPVSGNEVPSGSMAEEVRDDVPAMLSEGEYVVPADVVRFHGIQTFEQLRDEAKIGMARMEADGRIGGQPVEQEEDPFPFAVEELEGFQEGGVVGDIYSDVMGSSYTPNQRYPSGSRYSGTGFQLRNFTNPRTGRTVVIPFFNGQPMQYIPPDFLEGGSASTGGGGVGDPAASERDRQEREAEIARTTPGTGMSALSMDAATRALRGEEQSTSTSIADMSPLDLKKIRDQRSSIGGRILSNVPVLGWLMGRQDKQIKERAFELLKSGVNPETNKVLNAAEVSALRTITEAPESKGAIETVVDWVKGQKYFDPNPRMGYESGEDFRRMYPNLLADDATTADPTLGMEKGFDMSTFEPESPDYSLPKTQTEKAFGTDLEGGSRPMYPNLVEGSVAEEAKNTIEKEGPKVGKQRGMTNADIWRAISDGVSGFGKWVADSPGAKILFGGEDDKKGKKSDSYSMPWLNWGAYAQGMSGYDTSSVNQSNFSSPPTVLKVNQNNNFNQLGGNEKLLALSLANMKLHSNDVDYNAVIAKANQETDGFSKLIENNMNYSHASFIKTFGRDKYEQIKHILRPKGSPGTGLNAQTVKAENVPILFNVAYGDKLGNQGGQDGYKYRGRAFIHITGKANYADVGRKLGIDFTSMSNEQLDEWFSSPKNSADASAAFLAVKKEQGMPLNTFDGVWKAISPKATKDALNKTKNIYSSLGGNNSNKKITTLWEQVEMSPYELGQQETGFAMPQPQPVGTDFFGEQRLGELGTDQQSQPLQQAYMPPQAPTADQIRLAGGLDAFARSQLPTGTEQRTTGLQDLPVGVSVQSDGQFTGTGALPPSQGFQNIIEPYPVRDGKVLTPEYLANLQDQDMGGFGSDSRMYDINRNKIQTSVPLPPDTPAGWGVPVYSPLTVSPSNLQPSVQSPVAGQTEAWLGQPKMSAKYPTVGGPAVKEYSPLGKPSDISKLMPKAPTPVDFTSLEQDRTISAPPRRTEKAAKVFNEDEVTQQQYEKMVADATRKQQDESRKRADNARDSVIRQGGSVQEAFDAAQTAFTGFTPSGEFVGPTDPGTAAMDRFSTSQGLGFNEGGLASKPKKTKPKKRNIKKGLGGKMAT